MQEIHSCIAGTERRLEEIPHPLTKRRYGFQMMYGRPGVKKASGLDALSATGCSTSTLPVVRSRSAKPGQFGQLPTTTASPIWSARNQEVALV